MDDETIDLGTVDLGAMPKGQDAKEAFENLAGDADFGDGSGHINVDRSVPSHPVVRLVNVEGLGGGGDGKDGVGIKEVVLDSYDAETRTSTYNVMSDEDPSQVLGTFTVTDGADGEDGADSTVPGPQGVGIKEVVLDSYDSQSRTYTYNVMSDETPSRVLGSFTVTDGQDGTPGGGGGGGGDNEDLTVYGNPTNYNGNATETTTYNGSAPKEIHLDGLVTLGTAQTITGRKTFNQYITVVPSTANGNASYMHPGLWILYTAESGYAVRFRGGSNGHEIGAIYVNTGSGTAGGAISLGGLSADTTYLFATPRTLPANATGEADKLVATLGWVTKYFQLKLTQGDGISLVTDPNDANKIKISSTVAPQIQSDWEQTDTSAKDFIKNKPTLAEVATSGSYNDLTDKPTIPAAQIQSDWEQTDTSAKDFIKNKPGNLVTTDTAQTISGAKTFTEDITLTSKQTTAVKTVVGRGVIDLYSYSGGEAVRFYSRGTTLVAKIESDNYGEMTITGSAVKLNAVPNVQPYYIELNPGVDDEKYVATLGWICDYYQKKLVAGTGISIDNAPGDANKMRISATGVGITANSNFDFITDIRYDDGKIQVKKRTATVTNGVITAVGNESGWTDKISTTPISNVQ